MTTEDPQTPKTENTDNGADGAAKDVQSDPAMTDDSGDWSGEGGATTDGPATDAD